MLQQAQQFTYLVVRLIAISRDYRSGDPDKGHRVGLGDQFSSRPTSRRLVAISRADQVGKRSDLRLFCGLFELWAWAGDGWQGGPLGFWYIEAERQEYGLWDRNMEFWTVHKSSLTNK